MAGRIIWQPQQIYAGKAIQVVLARDFAKRMLEAKVSVEKQQRLNEIAHEIIFGKINHARDDYFLFERGTGLVTQVKNAADKGASIHLSRGDIESLKRSGVRGPIVYGPDDFGNSADRFEVLRLFDLWIEYSQPLIKDKVRW